MTKERIVAVGLLTARDVELLGPAFDRLWRVDEAPCFSQLLKAIDDADRDIRCAAEARDGAGKA
jgi:hypothetical protein